MALIQITKTADGSLPKRIPVLPAGALIKGEDGRAWTANDRKALLARLNKPGNKLVLDENHSSIRSAPKGGPSPALGFVSDFSEDADGVMYANAIEWTPYGEAHARNYGGISPVLLHRQQNGTIGDTAVLGDITNLHSVSFVNDPNLCLPALCDKELPLDPPTPEEPEMKPEDLVAALNAALAPTVAAVAALTTKVEALETVKAENAKDPKAEQFALSVNSKMEGLITAGKLENSPEARAYFCSRAKDEAALATVSAEYDARNAMVSTNAIELAPDLKTGAPKLAPRAVAAFASVGWDVTELHKDQPGLFRG